MPRQKKTLSLEDYAFFLEDPFNDDALTTAQLNQIILMHGFRRIHKRSKRKVFDALSTIDLIAPQRSTLEDNFSPYDDASLSLGEAKQDLESLKWQECTVQSIETVLHNHKNDDQVKSNGRDDAMRSFVRSSFNISKKRRRSRRMRVLSSIVDDSGAVHGNTGGGGGDADVAIGGVKPWGSSLYVDTYSWEF